MSFSVLLKTNALLDFSEFWRKLKSDCLVLIGGANG